MEIMTGSGTGELPFLCYGDGVVMEIQVIRSSRKSFSLELRPKGLVARVPLRAGRKQIGDFIDKHQGWIDKVVARQKARREEIGCAPLAQWELHALAEAAAEYIPQRVALYAAQVGVTYGQVTIRSQKTRWGSCSAKGNLNFNCLLMLAPAQVIDSVVVHELCHRKEMNHSQRFYAEVLRVFPEYRRWYGWLKEHGPALMARLTG